MADVRFYFLFLVVMSMPKNEAQEPKATVFCLFFKSSSFLELIKTREEATFVSQESRRISWQSQKQRHPRADTLSTHLPLPFS